MVEQDFIDTGALGDLEFVMEKGVASIPLPNTVPVGPKMTDLPHDILKSSTVENLISQNEDLMARLKVALRRLSQIEMENRRLAQETEQGRHEVGVARDQVMIYKEKDGAWKSKLETVAKERDILKEKHTLLAKQNAEFEGEIARYQQYQQNIQTTVKPYVDELKEYSKSLEAKVAAMTAEDERKDATIRDLRYQIVEVTRNSKYQLEQQDARNHELIDSYENSIKDQQAELVLLREGVRELELKNTRLNKAEHRANELENRLVESERAKTELAAKYETEVRRLGEKSDGMVKDYARISMENQELARENGEIKGRLEGLEFAKSDLLTQLESLRYMWQGKNEEAEKLKLSLGSLEKLNVELSSKIQEMREKA